MISIKSQSIRGEVAQTMYNFEQVTIASDGDGDSLMYILVMLVVYLLHCCMWKSTVPPRVPSWRYFRMLATISRIPLTLEPSLKIIGMLTAVRAGPGAVICLSLNCAYGKIRMARETIVCSYMRSSRCNS